MKYSLYVKTHTVTNLKYLGFTKSHDPSKYLGSGLYWLRHLKKHSNQVSTEILFESESLEEIKEKGIYYSNLWNITASDEWANLKPETGIGGFVPGFKYTKEHIDKRTATRRLKTKEIYDKVRTANIGRKRTAQVRKFMSERKRELMNEEKRKNYSESRLGTKNPAWKGYIQTEDGIFESSSAAARYYNCTDKTILNRIRSKNLKFSAWVRLPMSWSPNGQEIRK